MLSSQDRSATICFLDGRTRFPPYLPHSCRYPAQVDLRAPSNVAAHSLSLQGTPTDVFQFLDIHFGRFKWKGYPFHYSPELPHATMTNPQKLVKNFIKILSFDRIFLCLLLTPDCETLLFLAYSESLRPSK